MGKLTMDPVGKANKIPPSSASLSSSLCLISGILLAQWIPASWGLDFVGTLALIALLMPMMTSRAEFICVVVAGITAVLCAWMPLKLGILVAMIAGVAAAMMKPLSAEEQDSE